MTFLELVEKAIAGKDLKKDELTVHLYEADFLAYGFSEDELYSAKVQDEIYYAVIDLYSNERLPTIFIDLD